MRAPAWLTLRRNRRQPDLRVVTVTVTADLAGFIAAMTQAAESFGRLGGTALETSPDPLVQAELDRGLPMIRTHAAHPMNQALKDHLRRRRWEGELAITRAEAVWYVRGGLDPRYTTPEARDAQVQVLGRLMDPPVAARCATAFLRGWVEHRPAVCECPPCPGRGHDGHGMAHCAECCWGTGVEADPACPVHGLGVTA